MQLFYSRVDRTLEIASVYSKDEGRNVRRIVLHETDAHQDEATGYLLKLSTAKVSELYGSDHFYFATTYELSCIIDAYVLSGREHDLCLLKYTSIRKILTAYGFVHDPVQAVAEVDLWQPTWRRPMPPSNSYHLAIVAPFGPFGDTIMFLTALRLLREFLAQRFTSLTFSLFQEPLSSAVHSLYEGSGLVDHIHALPQPLSALATCDGVLDLTERPTDIGRIWLDALLDGCGVQSESIDRRRKRNQVYLPISVRSQVASIMQQRVCVKRRRLFLHTKASTPLRSMPDSFLHRLLELLAADSRYEIVSAVAMPKAFVNVRDLSEHSHTIEHAAAILEGCDVFVSVDTSLYHLADGLRKPGVVLFTSIIASERLAFYPQIRGLQVFPPDNPYSGHHAGHHPDVIVYAEQAWSNFHPAVVLQTLEECLV